MHVLADVETRFSRCEVAALFTTDKNVSRGTIDVGVAILSRSIPRLHHLEFKNLLCFRMTKASERRKQKPLRSSELGRGSNVRTFEMRSAHFASARKRACINLRATQWVERGQRVLDECVIASHRSFSFSARDCRSRRGGCMIPLHGSVKAKNATLRILYLK